MTDDAPPDPATAATFFRTAEEDLAGARFNLGGPVNRFACFLAQQAAETALKAGLAMVTGDFPRIHSLTALLARFPVDRRPAVDRADLEALGPWSIIGRYPEDMPDIGQGQAAVLVDCAERVVEACRPIIERPAP